MTEGRPNRRPGAGPVVWISLLLFCVLLGLLTYRFSIGRDPSGASAAGAEPAPVRKVIVRRVVTTVVPGAAAPAPKAGAAASAPASTEPVPEPVTTSAS
jgi:hypothetical protein